MISVIIPTFRRPMSLIRAVRSVFAQDTAALFELVVIDNSPEGSAAHALRALQIESPVPMRYGHEPRIRAAHARNAALKLASGAHIAWLDDDQEASSNWLAQLSQVMTRTRADCVFGPIHARAPQDSLHRRRVEALYSRQGPEANVIIDRIFGINNSIMKRSTMLANAYSFDASEHDVESDHRRLLLEARDNGARFAWAAQADVTAHIGAARARLAHLLLRAYASGQGHSGAAWRARDWRRLAQRMGLGAGEALAYSTAAGVAALIGAPKAYDLIDRAAEGAGKVWWFQPQRLYGAAYSNS